MSNEEVYDLDGLKFRKATKNDLEKFDQIVSAYNFDIGLHNWQLFHSVSGDNFWVYVNDDDKIVGIFSGNIVNDDFIWGHQVAILPEYRNKNRFHSALFILKQNRNLAANWNEASIRAFRKDSFHLGHKLVGFYGKLGKARNPVVPPEGVQLIKLKNVITENDTHIVEELFKYDNKTYANLHAPNRRLWLERWIFSDNPSHSISIVAYNTENKTVCGFGVGRFMTANYSSITPVYSDSDSIAYSLLCEIANCIRRTAEHVYLEFNAKRRICFKFVNEEHLALTYSNFRIYYSEFCNLPLEKQYCDNEFWPI